MRIGIERMQSVLSSREMPSGERIPPAQPLYHYIRHTQSSNREAELRTCCSALRLRDLKTRVFLEPGPPGERVKGVANALDADLIVSSCDYHRRFLSYSTDAPTGTLRLQGVACPVLLVNDALAIGHQRVCHHPGGDSRQITDPR